MSPEHRNIPEPGELVYTPRPSWAPAFFALGVAGMVCGIYGEGFMVRGWIYSIIGAIFFLAAFRSLIRGAVRDYYRLPRKQKTRGAALPVETITPPSA
ncbi:MAG TPA: hypothetical protein VG518_06505 [Solirubrobacterales bacterium]|nr:hypothetical protein [Solirubrobacterales bacterium]